MASELSGICRTRLTIASLLAALVTTAAAGTHQTALTVLIDGTPVPLAAQPRVVVEQQHGVVDRARIQLSGPLSVQYAGTITPSDAIEIIAQTPDGETESIFGGKVMSIESVFDQAQPQFVVYAAGALPRGDDPPVTSRVSHEGAGGDARLRAFLPRLSATASLQGVLVVGIDASSGAQVVGRAMAPTIRLDGGPDDDFGRILSVTTDRRFSSREEADDYALLLLMEQTVLRISAEVLTDGIPGLRVGDLLELDGTNDRFNGQYRVAGVTHRFGGGSYGSSSTVIRVRRVDLGMFRLPEIDEEVLVAFEGGDLTRPLIVASWWDCDSVLRPERSEETSHCRLLRWPW